MRRKLALVAAVLLLALTAAPVRGQSVGASELEGVPVVPFGPGERMAYRVVLGPLGTVGHSVMEVVGIDTLRGSPTYHLRFDLEGGVLFAHVDDRLQSWLDVKLLTSRRFEQDQKEVKYRRHRVLDFYPEQRRWRIHATGESGRLPTSLPLDEISFLYYVRSLPLEVGKTYTFRRYFHESGNPVVVKVLRRETVTVPAGTFRTIVIRPIIRSNGLFGEGGQAEVYFTDDERRLIVQLKSKVPVLGSLDLYLEDVTLGRRLMGAPFDPSRSADR